MSEKIAEGTAKILTVMKSVVKCQILPLLIDYTMNAICGPTNLGGALAQPHIHWYFFRTKALHNWLNLNKLEKA